MGNNTTMTKCYANVGKNRTWFQRLKGYFLDNADYFATASAMLEWKLQPQASSNHEKYK